MNLRHQQEGKYDGTPALWRLLSRKAQANPVGVPVFAAKNFGLKKIEDTKALRLCSDPDYDRAVASACQASP